MSEFQKEWAIIHKDIEKYERFSLLIKLSAVFVGVGCVVFSVNGWFSSLFILVLWLQEGIWKTFQKRMEKRILYVEQRVQSKASEGAFQLYSQWQMQRQGMIGVVKEYLFNALKPTVAFPYAVLLGVLVIVSLSM